MGASEGNEGGALDLAEFLSPILPSYMVPSTFAELDSLPLSGNGKVDRKALERQLGALATTTRPYVAPSSPEEEQMLALWESTLDRGPIGMHDDFFQLGATRSTRSSW